MRGRAAAPTGSAHPLLRLLVEAGLLAGTEPPNHGKQDRLCGRGKRIHFSEQIAGAVQMLTRLGRPTA